jgi:Xaa-Pro aminopeptidase
MNFSSDFFARNRERLTESLPHHLIVIPAHCLLQMSADQNYPFKQDNSFWYLTGINEPELVVCIDTELQKTFMFLPDQSEFHTEWDGAYDVAEIKKISGIENIEPMAKLTDYIANAHEEKKQIGYLEPLPDKVEPYGFYSNPSRRNLAEIIKTIVSEPKDIRIDLARLRQVKQPVEIEAIRSAIDITAKALEQVQEYIKSNKGQEINEKSIENILSKNFIETGGHAYEPIVASGKNAATIHYMKNSAPVEQNTFLLLDVGAKVMGYSADISRTWFVGNNITNRHKQFYAAVQDIQEYAFGLLGPGVILKEYQELVEVFAFKIFNKLGIEMERYPHGFSHFLGLDTHDAGDYNSPLVENSVITVEPGIYLPEEGFGIRIEDDVLITKTGIEVMSKQIPSNLLYYN